MTDKRVDESTILRCQKGDTKAFEKLVDIYGNKIFRYFLGLTDNTHISNDLLGDFYLKIVKNIKKYNGKGSFEGWLFTVASNIFRDYLRKKTNTKRVLEEYQNNETHKSSSATPEYDEELIAKALNIVDMDTKELIMMHYLSDLTFREISQQTGRPIGTVLAKIHRGIKKIKTRFEESSEEIL